MFAYIYFAARWAPTKRRHTEGGSQQKPKQLLRIRTEKKKKNVQRLGWLWWIRSTAIRPVAFIFFIFFFFFFQQETSALHHHHRPPALLSFSTKSHTHAMAEGGDVESLDEWSLSHLISNASAMKSTTKSHKAMTYTYSIVLAYCKSKLWGRLHITFCVWLFRSIEKREEEKEPSSHHAPSRSVRKKIRQPVDNNSNNREEEERINKNKSKTKQKTKKKTRKKKRQRQRTRKERSSSSSVSKTTTGIIKGPLVCWWSWRSFPPSLIYMYKNIYCASYTEKSIVFL